MTASVTAEIAFYKSVMPTSKNTALADLQAEYYSGVAAGTVGAAPAASLTVAGTVKKGAFVSAAAVPFADLTAAANAYNALRTSLINAGVLAAS